MRNKAKEDAVNQLASKVQACTKCEPALCNIIAAKSKSGIGYWSDAFPNYNARLMIVGQDWGDEKYFKAFGDPPVPYREEGNPTWENLMKYLKAADFRTGYGEFEFTDIYLTNALLCIRKGNIGMSGDKNIATKWFDNCYPFLKTQIDIIKPKVIATLGERVFRVLARHNGISYRRFREEVAQPQDIGNGMIIFPLYHTGYWGSLNRGRVEGSFVDDFKNLKALIDRC